jgi:hypothetical protein
MCNEVQVLAFQPMLIDKQFTHKRKADQLYDLEHPCEQNAPPTPIKKNNSHSLSERLSFFIIFL